MYKKVNSDEVVLASISDLHLSHMPPGNRAEPNWYDVMEAHLIELESILMSHGHPPLAIAGDLFHYYNPPPRLITFAMERLPRVPIYSVAGQHDLAYHDLSRLKDTAYGSLIAAGRIEHLISGASTRVMSKGVWLGLTGYSWGQFMEHQSRADKHVDLQVAVVHEFCWRGKEPFPGAPTTNHIRKIAQKLTHFDVAFFGDHHQPFIDELQIINCGCFMRRRTDERKYDPSVYLLFGDGRVHRQHLLTPKKDQWLQQTDRAADDYLDAGWAIDNFVRNLEDNQNSIRDFPEAVRQYILAHNPRAGVKAALYDAIGETFEGK